MVFSVKRRAFLLGCSLVGVSCAPSGELTLPGVRSESIPRSEPPVLRPDEGIVTGVAIFAGRHVVGSERWAMHRIVFAEVDSQQQYSVRMFPALDDTTELLDNGELLRITPFAMAVPARRYRVLGYAIFAPTGWRVMSFPDARFSISAGQVGYIGGVGQAVKLVDGALAYLPFLSTDRTRDEPLIRSAFPSLDSARLEPVRIDADEAWRGWPIAPRSRQS